MSPHCPLLGASRTDVKQTETQIASHHVHVPKHSAEPPQKHPQNEEIVTKTTQTWYVPSITQTPLCVTGGVWVSLWRTERGKIQIVTRV